MIDPKEEPEIINKLYEIESPSLLNPVSQTENLSVNQVEDIIEGPMFSFTTLFWWLLVVILFIIFMIYYLIKYTANESNYIIKKNASGFKLSLDELTQDVKDFLRRWIEWFQSWNENISDKSRQFFFRQHVEDNTFKTKRNYDRKTRDNKYEKEKPDE
jgi:uncharacterized protein YxeA